MTFSIIIGTSSNLSIYSLSTTVSGANSLVNHSSNPLSSWILMHSLTFTLFFFFAFEIFVHRYDEMVQAMDRGFSQRIVKHFLGIHLSVDAVFQHSSVCQRFHCVGAGETYISNVIPFLSFPSGNQPPIPPSFPNASMRVLFQPPPSPPPCDIPLHWGIKPSQDQLLSLLPDKAILCYIC